MTQTMENGVMCEEIHEWLLAYAEGELDPAARRHVSAHVAECGACRAELASVTTLVSELQAVPGGLARLHGRPALNFGAVSAQLSAPVATVGVYLAAGSTVVQTPVARGHLAWRSLAGALALAMVMLFALGWQAQATAYATTVAAPQPFVAMPGLGQESAATPMVTVGLTDATTNSHLATIHVTSAATDERVREGLSPVAAPMATGVSRP